MSRDEQKRSNCDFVEFAMMLQTENLIRDLLITLSWAGPENIKKGSVEIKTSRIIEHLQQLDNYRQTNEPPIPQGT